MEQKKIWDYFQGEGSVQLEVGAPRFRYLVRRASRRVPRRPRTALNIGIGSGTLEFLARDAGWQIHGVDPSDVAVTRLTQAGLDARVGTLDSLPYGDGEFDVVFASEVFEHLPADYLQTGLREIVRVLRPEGWLLGTVPYEEDLATSETVCPDCGKRFHRWGHVQTFSIDSVTGLLLGHFQTARAEVRAFPDFTRPSPKDKIKSAIRWTMGRFGALIAMPNIVFEARKGPDR